MRSSAAAAGLSASAFQNLGYQINDIVTGLANGQSPFMILAQQGGQVQQVPAGAQGGVGGALQAIGSRLASMVTVGRLAFGGIVAGATAAALAANSYLDAQQRVAMTLTGAGRASGATAGSIGRIASAGASTFGLSVSEARDLATALAATGKVANDDLLPIVKIGKDIALAFGTDAARLPKCWPTPSRIQSAAPTRSMADSASWTPLRSGTSRTLSTKIDCSMRSARCSAVCSRASPMSRTRFPSRHGGGPRSATRSRTDGPISANSSRLPSDLAGRSTSSSTRRRPN
ncbi:phage tail length tape measure family protein [Bradyrhizobium ottawaense]|uniref:phage tail length tape measure family protein n=1 Tax=Bradyrhizobium ottawaense TaxID=931866 RepID=UPI003850CE61